MSIMNGLELLKTITQYEDELLAFVQAHQAQLIDHWHDWLEKNPLPRDITEKVEADDKIRVALSELSAGRG